MDGSIYTHISKNKFLTFEIMIFFIIFITFLGWLFGEYFAGDGLLFIGFALIFSGITSFYSYYNSDKIVLKLAHAYEVLPEQNQYLHALVENMCIASGLPKPKIYMTNDIAMNAFATGRDPEHAVLCFTRGIVEKLDKRELEGVVAHELSHVGNYDIRLMSIVSVLVGTIALITDWFTRGMFFGRSRNRESNSSILFLVGLLLMIISPFIATIIKLAVSRNREYLADASAAMITRYPQGLAHALEKLAKDENQISKATNATAHMYISNPFNKANVSKLFNTHPPIEDRIARLMAM